MVFTSNSKLRKHHRCYYRTALVARSVVETTTDFCEVSSLHGFRLLGMQIANLKQGLKFLRLVGTLIWTVAILVGFILAIFLMNKIWERYSISPTITTIETKNYPISSVLFPGVTICNINVVNKPQAEALYKLMEDNKIPTDENTWNFFKNLFTLINYDEVDGDYSDIFESLVKLNYTIDKLMRTLAQPCESLLKKCYWLGKATNCSEIFRTTTSGFGFCCSFNYKALRSYLEVDINSDNYYQINAPLIRISGAGEDVSLRVFVDVEPQNYLSAKRFFYGTEIIIHDPEDFPEKSLLTAFSQPGTDVSIAVLPSVVATEKDVKSLPVNLRFCRFEYERPLQITKKYSFQSCITECRAITIFKTCGCIPFFYPALKVSEDQKEPPRQCNLKDVKCLADNRHIFSSLEPTGETYSIYNGTINGMNCDCVPSCTEQAFGVETFMSQRIDGVRSSAFFQGVANLSSIVVYFKDLSCIKYRREMFMTWDGLLASFGGIFGLCLGGSVLSLVEIVYYATFRLYTKIRKNKKEADKEAMPTVNILYKGKFMRLPPRPTGKYQLRQIYEKNDPKQFLW